MKKPINEIKKMQLLAGLITENEYQESLINPTIVKIEPGRNTGMAFGAIGSAYKITLSDGSVVDSNDDDLLDRYEEVRSGRKSIDQLNAILVGKEWITSTYGVNENEDIQIPLPLRLKYQKWIKSEQPDYFGGNRDQELTMRAFLKILNEYPDAVRGQFLRALDAKYGEIPKRFRHHLLNVIYK